MSEEISPLLGAVLAGGAGSRLGGEKAGLELGGWPLIGYPLTALARAGVPAIVVAKPESRLPALSTPIVIEPADPHHPLLGVVAALKHAGGRPVLVLPCDAPFISDRLMGALAAEVGIAAARTGGQAHPLIARYSADAAGRLEEAITEGASATEALESLSPQWIEASEEETFNVNTAADLERAAALLRRLRS